MSELVNRDIKAVVFDFDDTLVGTYKPIWNLHRRVAKTEYGIDLDDERLLKYWGQPIHTLTTHYYDTSDTETALEHLKNHAQHFPKETFAGTEPTLRSLKLANKVIGIVTASYDWILRADMEFANIPTELIDYTQTAEDTPVHKPDPRVFDPMLAWMNQKDININEILYVGDGLHDMNAARDAGMHFVGVTTGLTTAAEFKAQGAASISNLSELTT